MGFNNTTTELSITAKLTPIGREKIVRNNINLIKTFSLGDSDANYNIKSILTSGEIPSLCGDIGANNSFNNSTSNLVSLKSTIVLNTNGDTLKEVSSQSSKILTETVYNGVDTITINNADKFIIDRNDANNLTNSKVNLFHSFGLPLDINEDEFYTGVTASNGGFSDTSIKDLSSEKILVFAIDNTKYGELIDGKSVKLEINTSGVTYEIYSTFEAGVNQLDILDSIVSDNSPITNNFGDNVAMLFCDTIKKPNNDPTLSWSTGYGLNKPYSINGKKPYNLQDNSNLGLEQDKLVGIIYLDKGLIVITNPMIIQEFNNSDLVNVTFDNLSTNIFQNITCIADRGEFGSSTNRTFGPNDLPRISEIFLYDELGTVIAVGKTDRHLTKNINEFLALSIKILL